MTILPIREKQYMRGYSIYGHAQLPRMYIRDVKKQCVDFCTLIPYYFCGIIGSNRIWRLFVENKRLSLSVLAEIGIISFYQYRK